MTQVVRAEKTEAMIAAMMKADQGARFRQLLEPLIMQSADAFEGGKDDFRSHLGGSSIGEECPRKLWYGFHWSRKVQHDGKTLRLFNRGHLEEPRFLAMLQMIGCKIYAVDEYGNQFRVSAVGGHFGSAIDGVIIGCPDMPNAPILGEFKTSNDKNFKKLVLEGVRASKWVHYVQMQIYMSYFKLTHALYMAVNKNDDDIYTEIIEFDQMVADTYFHRAEKIVLADTIPARISESPAFFKCKFCDYREVCHMSAPVALNCRTCAGSVPTPDGAWHCVKFSVKLDKPTQLLGCQEWDKRTEYSL